MVDVYQEDRWVLFGSGDLVHIEDDVELIEEGTPKIGLLMTPNSYLEQKYSLKWGEEISNEDGLLRMKYPKTSVTILPPANRMQFILVSLGFKGEETLYSKKDISLREQIKLLEQTNESLHGANMRLMEENKKLGTRYMEYFKDMRKMGRMIGVRQTTEMARQDILDKLEGGEDQLAEVKNILKKWELVIEKQTKSLAISINNLRTGPNKEDIDFKFNMLGNISLTYLVNSRFNYYDEVIRRYNDIVESYSTFVEELGKESKNLERLELEQQIAVEIPKKIRQQEMIQRKNTTIAEIEEIKKELKDELKEIKSRKEDAPPSPVVETAEEILKKMDKKKEEVEKDYRKLSHVQRRILDTYWSLTVDKRKAPIILRALGIKPNTTQNITYRRSMKKMIDRGILPETVVRKYKAKPIPKKEKGKKEVESATQIEENQEENQEEMLCEENEESAPPQC